MLVLTAESVRSDAFTRELSFTAIPYVVLVGYAIGDQTGDAWRGLSIAVAAYFYVAIVVRGISRARNKAVDRRINEIARRNEH
ncbi:hypothetical protein A5786_01790 [Gordonia sp. 852002-50816_SCH5313054-a]|nr:hypothetical protein A5786_01790 [Gordonia sp. 852002-50816_SCH5313054-a]